MSARTKAILGWTAVVVLILAAWAGIGNDFYLRLMMVAEADMVAAIPFGLLMGHMGYLAMGQAAFFGLGAYVIGNLTVLRFEADYWLALPVAILCTAAIAYLLTLPLFRLRGYHFAIGTLGVGQLAYLLFLSWDWFTGGKFGTNGVPFPAIGKFTFDTNSRLFLLAALFLFIAALTSWLITRGPIGLALRAIRQDEDLAAARGLDVLRYKRFIFVFAATFAGIAGALYAPMQISFDPSSFTIWRSFQFVIYVIIGGTGTLVGPVLGVVFVTILQQVIQDFGKWNQIVFGALIVMVVLFFRGGIWGGIRALARHTAGLLPRRNAAAVGGVAAVQGKNSGQ